MIKWPIKPIHRLLKIRRGPTRLGELLERNSAILFNLNSAETSEAIQQITQQASPLLTQFQNDVRLNQPLFERIKKIHENQDTSKSFDRTKNPFGKRIQRVLLEMVHC